MEKLEPELARSKRWGQEIKASADEIARSSYNSPSQSGDRFHSQSQAEIAKESFSNLESFYKRLVKSAESAIPQAVEPISYVEVEYEGGELRSFYFVDRTPNLPGFNFVSSESSLGKLLFGKRVGEKIELKFGEEKRLTRIVYIE